MDAQPKVQVLCVDDEVNVLHGLSLTLERRYELATAIGGPAALAFLQQTPKVAVIVSDMRMPGMDGATFLAQARQLAPDAVRMLLTGQTDLQSAISAVNDGQIFRFLTKPCAPTALLSAVQAAVEQYRLLRAERELLEETLHGCIRALTDVLALTSPAAFGRATRIKALAGELARRLSLREVWRVEVAAMLSQLAHITLAPETAERMYFGRPLSVDEQRQVDRLPAITEQLLANIPRMQDIREILANYRKPPVTEPATADDNIASATHVLRAAVEFDALESLGGATSRALERMRERGERYLPAVMEALAQVRDERANGRTIKELAPGELIVGMELAEDVFLHTGVMLVARGHEITPRFMERIRNLPQGTLKKKLRVALR